MCSTAECSNSVCQALHYSAAAPFMPGLVTVPPALLYIIFISASLNRDLNSVYIMKLLPSHVERVDAIAKF